MKPLYETQFEKRAADMALFPFAAAPEPAAPDEAELQRWYDNHPDSYSTPEYRRIKAIELSPQSLSSEITITDEELHSAYEEHKAEYVTPEKRSAEVISAPDETKARTLADKWRGGTDWAAMQAAAQAEGASAIAQDDATPVQFPDPDLAKAVFSTPADAVSEPVKGQLGLVRGEGDENHRRNDHDVRAGEGQAAGTGAGQQGGGSDVRPGEQAGSAAGERDRAG